MKTLPQRKTTRLTSFDYSQPSAIFLTICTANRRCILSRIVGTGVLDGPQVELTKHGEIAEKYMRQMSDFYDHLTVDYYVIMPNHIHFLLEIKNGPSGTPVPTAQNTVSAKFVSAFKRFCNKEYGHNIWQARSYDHVIRNQQDYTEHIQYITDNPARWAEDELYVP